MQAVWLQELDNREALGRLVGDKVGGESRGRHADHVKDFKQKSVKIQGC